MEYSGQERMPPGKKIEKGREPKNKYSIGTKSCGIVRLRNCYAPVVEPEDDRLDANDNVLAPNLVQNDLQGERAGIVVAVEVTVVDHFPNHPINESTSRDVFNNERHEESIKISVGR